MSHLRKILIFSIFLHFAQAQDRILFEETITDQSKLPADGRLPLLFYEGCDENELYYPGDQENDWICDCKPGYIYVPEYEKCYPIYEQGPCERGSYLYLADTSSTPYCRPNPCVNYNKILYNGKCIVLGGPCESGGYYIVNEETLKIECFDPIAIRLQMFVEANRNSARDVD